MITGIVMTIILILGIFAVRNLIKTLSESGHNDMAEALKKVEQTFLAKGQEMIEAGRGQVKDRTQVPGELLNRLVQEGADYLFASLKINEKGSFFDLDNKNYAFVITEDRDHPFQVTPLIAETAKKLTNGKITDSAKAQAIFDWFEKDVKYGRSKLKSNVGYRHAPEVFNDREGVCGEMAILYVVMARSVGLASNYVSVDRDCQGKDVHHACAAVYLDGSNTLIDPAYHMFDIRHRRFDVLDDKEAVPHFKAFRANKGG